MDSKLILLFALGFFLLAFLGSQQFTIFGTQTQTVKVSLNPNTHQYEARVEFIHFKPYRYCGGALYPYRFRVVGLDKNVLADNYCYLKLDEVTSQPCYGRRWAWHIENLVLYAPYENGICDFWNKGKISNPDQSYYVYGSYTQHVKYSCKQWDCLGMITHESSGAKGLLFFKVKQLPFVDCTQLTGKYCADSSVEVREYYCKSPIYGNDKQCLAGYCAYKTVIKEACPWYTGCYQGNCELLPILYIRKFVNLLFGWLP